MKTSTLLCKTRLQLYVHQPYICNVLKQVGDDVRKGMTWTEQDQLDDQIDNVLDLIAVRLDGCYTFESWLNRNHRLVAYVTEDLNKVREARFAWMDSMIAEFKAKGD